MARTVRPMNRGDMMHVVYPNGRLEGNAISVQELHKAGQTIIMVTHEDEYSRFADRIVILDDGRIVKTAERL